MALVIRDPRMILRLYVYQKRAITMAFLHKWDYPFYMLKCEVYFRVNGGE